MAIGGVKRDKENADFTQQVQTNTPSGTKFVDESGNYIYVDFSEDGTLATVTLEDGTTFDTVSEPSGSGSRYVNETYELRGQASEIMLYKDGQLIFEGNSESVTKSVICPSDQKVPGPCTREYAPVCGDNGITYSNSCEACRSGLIDSHIKGECS